MSKLNWDQTGEHYYETGVSQGVLFPWEEEHTEGGVTVPAGYGVGVAWNGLTSVNESPSGAEATALYADNIKYLNLFSAEEFGGTIEAYTYPDEFAECDGSAVIIPGATMGQQNRKMFGLVYKTIQGNDTEGNDFGYKLHIVYGCKASPSEKSYETVNDSPDAITFSWEFTTTPVDAGEYKEEFKPTSLIVLDSNKVGESKMASIEASLFGTDPEGSDPGSEPTLLMPEDIIDILRAA